MDFGPRALPYCSFSRPDGTRRLGVGLGTDVVDLLSAGISHTNPALLGTGTLDPLLEAGVTAWTDLREEIVERAVTGRLDRARHRQDEVTLHLAWSVADYVDFYSSRHHAENVGRIFRPDADPLPPNWLHQPIGYHGRSGTVVVDGTPVRRPSGQTRGADGVLTFGPTAALDFELELGWVVGGATPLGEPVSVDEAADHLFGVVLVNDWSARDIQAWEYVPLGPFLGKSFATTVSAWVMPVGALSRVPAGPQEPPPLPYLRDDRPWTFDLDLEASVESVDGIVEVCRVGSREGLYWTPVQQLAHLTSNGASLRAGDLFASGTVSGPAPGQQGCLLEASRGGVRPVVGTRSYLADGDRVTIGGRASTPNGPVPLGPATGIVVAPS